MKVSETGRWETNEDEYSITIRSVSRSGKQKSSSNETVALTPRADLIADEISVTSVCVALQAR